MLRSGEFAFYHNQEYELYENGDGTVRLVTDHPQIDRAWIYKGSLF